MKPTIFITIFICALGVASGHAAEILVDFGVAGKTTEKDTQGRVWNNAVWKGAGHVSKLQLKDTKGNQTGVSLFRVEGFLGAFDAGTNPQDLYPESAGADRWSLEQGKVTSGKLEISGFSANQAMDLVFFGTRQAPIPFPTRFSVGGNSKVLNAQNNTNRTVTLKDVRASSSGSVVVTVSLDNGRNGHLGVMEIIPQSGTKQVTPAPKPAPPKPAPKPTPPKPKPKPAEKPAPVAPSTDDAERQQQLKELGLGDDGNSGLFLIGGMVMISLGLVVIGVSIWYYLRPEPVATDHDSET